MYREGAMTDQTCQKWFVNFCAGDFLLDNSPWLGRPVEVNSNQTETLTKNNQRSTMWETADILKISKSIKLLVKMKNASFSLWKKPYRFLANPQYMRSQYAFLVLLCKGLNRVLLQNECLFF